MLKIVKGEVVYVRYTKQELSESKYRKHEENRFLNKAYHEDLLSGVDLFHEERSYKINRRAFWMDSNPTETQLVSVEIANLSRLIANARLCSIPIESAVLERFKRLKEEADRNTREREEARKREEQELLERAKATAKGSVIWKGRTKGEILRAFRSGKFDHSDKRDQLVLEMCLDGTV